MANFNLWQILLKLFNVIVNLGATLWNILNTPYSELITSLPDWAENILANLNEYIGDLTLIDAFIPLLAIFILVKVLSLLIPN